MGRTAGHSVWPLPRFGPGRGENQRPGRRGIGFLAPVSESAKKRDWSRRISESMGAAKNRRPDAAIVLRGIAGGGGIGYGNRSGLQTNEPVHQLRGRG